MSARTLDKRSCNASGVVNSALAPSKAQQGTPTQELGYLLSIKQVMAHVGLGKTSIYKRISAGTFPRPVKLSEQCVKWRSQDLAEWMRRL